MFIYRGKDYERLADFVAGLQQQFPNAQLMNKTTQPDKAVMESENQSILSNGHSFTWEYSINACAIMVMLM